MRKLLSTFLLLYCSCGFASEREVLIYSAHPEFAPMSWIESGKLIGLGPELVETIFAEIGVPVESKFFPWRRVFENAREGRIDVIASLYFTKERDQFLIYSDTHYAESRTVLITLKGDEFSFTEWEDLIGRKGGAILGDSWGEEFDLYIKTQLDVDNVYTYKQNFLKLLSGRIEYIIATENNARILSTKLELLEQVSILPVAINTEREYVAFSQHSPFLEYLPMFNAKLRQMVESGEVDKLKEKFIEKAILTNKKTSK